MSPKYTDTYGSFWKERLDKVIRFAQIRIAQMSREPTELTSGGVGGSAAGSWDVWVFDQSQGENLLGWCALEGRS